MMEKKMQVAKERSFGRLFRIAECYPAFPPYSRRVPQMLLDQVKHLTESPIFGDIGAVRA